MTTTKENQQIEEITSTLYEKECALILYNDDYHTFDFVIDALIKICSHTPEQAEQCAYIVHFKGKCDVKNGNREKLLPLRRALAEKGLKATVENKA